MNQGPQRSRHRFGCGLFVVAKTRRYRAAHADDLTFVFPEINKPFPPPQFSWAEAPTIIDFAGILDNVTASLCLGERPNR